MKTITKLEQPIDFIVHGNVEIKFFVRFFF